RRRRTAGGGRRRTRRPGWSGGRGLLLLAADEPEAGERADCQRRDNAAIGVISAAGSKTCQVGAHGFSLVRPRDDGLTAYSSIPSSIEHASCTDSPNALTAIETWAAEMTSGGSNRITFGLLSVYAAIT